jgi:hypothetical protein
MIVSCGDCGADFGDIQNFGFIRQGDRGFHFVSKTFHAEVLTSNNSVYFGDELVRLPKERSSYVIAYCTTCGSDVGKKFSKDTSEEYIAFGKEKIKYGDLTLRKKDKWSLLESNEPFASLDRFLISNFRKTSSKYFDDRRKGPKKSVDESGCRFERIPNESRSCNDFRVGNCTRGRSCKFSHNDNDNIRASTNKSFLLGGRSDPNLAKSKSMNEACSKYASHKNDHSEANYKTERSIVGASLSSRLAFLTRIHSWEADKVIYELSGPNKTNWENICGILNCLYTVYTISLF